MVKVLMVCTGNTCRSPMAAALFKQAAQERGIVVEVDSAGLMASTGEFATYYASVALEEFELDLKEHQSAPVDFSILDAYDFIFTMTNGHKCQIIQLRDDLADRVYVLKEMAHNILQETGKPKEKNKGEKNVAGNFDLSDPYGQSLQAYRHTASEIVKAINIILDHWQHISN